MTSWGHKLCCCGGVYGLLESFPWAFVMWAGVVCGIGLLWNPFTFILSLSPSLSLSLSLEYGNLILANFWPKSHLFPHLLFPSFGLVNWIGNPIEADGVTRKGSWAAKRNYFPMMCLFLLCHLILCTFLRLRISFIYIKVYREKKN